MAWTDEKKAEVIEAYEAANPTPENSMGSSRSLQKNLKSHQTVFV